LFTKFNDATEVSNENRMFGDEMPGGWGRRWREVDGASPPAPTSRSPSSRQTMSTLRPPGRSANPDQTASEATR